MSYTYDMIVIGGGAAGLTAAGISANLGAHTLLVEGDRLGGDCTWTGCVPSKTLLKAANVAHSMRNASKFGLVDQDPEINFETLMNHVRSVRSDVYEEADRPGIFTDMGIDVEQGMASFKDEHRIRIENKEGEQWETDGKYIILATGSKPFIPPIDGIEGVTYLTNESLFEINTLPEEFLIVGGGPIGVEMGQAFARLGSSVTMIDQQKQILNKDDPELSNQLREQLEKEGINFYLDTSARKVKQDENGRIKLTVDRDDQQSDLYGDRLLIAAGRNPQLNALDLSHAGVEYSRDGISVDTRCRSSVRHIYACGDVTGRYQFTHMSEHMAKVAVTNALLKVPKRMDEDNVPWCTYTDPEMAHVGKRERDLRKSGVPYKTYRFPFDMIDRAITEGQTEGMIKVHAKKSSGKILGVSILGAHAGEMISEYALAMRQGITLRQLSDTVHPYPTYGLGNRRAADQWYVQNQSEWMISVLQTLFGYRGSMPDLSDPDRIV